MAKKDPNEPDNKAQRRLDEFNRQREAIPNENDDEKHEEGIKESDSLAEDDLDDDEEDDDDDE
jgi:hypothetical protein